MLCGKMSAGKSKDANTSLNSSGSSLVSLEPLRSSWADEVLRAEHDEPNSCRSLNSSTGSHNVSGRKSLPEAMDHSNVVSDDNLSVSQDREISLEFIDGKNEEKFERLVKEEKLKTPFKRRHSGTPSNESRSNSPISSNSEGDAVVSAQRTSTKEEAQKRQRNNSYGSSSSSSWSASKVESDPAVLARRQKQIDYGKNSLAYERYIELVPRQKRTRDHPRTPNKYGKYSRRTFDGLIKVWRKQLHHFDPPEEPKMTLKSAGGVNADSDDSDTDSD